MSFTGIEDAPAELQGPGLPSAIVALLAGLAGAFFYWVAQGSVAGLGQSDPAGNAMSAGFAVIAEFLLWLCLAIYLVAMCWRSRLHAGVLVPAAVLAVAAAIACLTAIGLMRQPTSLRIVPTVLPLLAVMFGLWARTSRELSPRIRDIVSIGIGGAALALVVIAFVEQAKWDAAAPQRAAAAEAAQRAYERDQAAHIAGLHARLRALGPDDRVDDYLEFIGSGWDEEVIAGIRTVRSRQADVERLIAGGAELYQFRRLPEFGISPTPALCTAYRVRMDRQLADFVPSNPTRHAIPGFYEQELDNLRWLLAGGCDLSAQIRRLRDQAREFTPQFYAPYFGDQLDALLGQAQ